MACSTAVVRFPVKEGVLGSNPNVPDIKKGRHFKPSL